ncbi:MAG: S9 family peptidase [Oligoflexus sp.]
MRYFPLLLLSSLTLSFFHFAQQGHAMPEAPKAKTVPHEITMHGQTRQDPYFWLRDRDSKDVIDYLNAENAYTAKIMSSTNELQEKLFAEMKDRVPKDDATAPYYYRGYFYYSRTEGDKDYHIYCRKKGSVGSPEEIILDVNQLAKDQSYLSVSAARVSPDGKRIAYAIDTQGRRIYTLAFKDLTSGETLKISIPDITGNFVWANDSDTIFYTKQDPVTLRSHQVYRFSLSKPTESQLVFEEKDETFSAYISKTRTDRFLLITSHSTLSTEVRYADANLNSDQWKVFQERQKDLEYGIEDGMDRFLIYTNHQAKNFQIMESPIEQTELQHWKTVIKHNPQVYLEDIEVFQDFFVVSEKTEGVTHYRVYDRKKKTSHHIKFEESAYLSHPYINRIYDTDTFVFTYESMTTPDSVYSYHVPSRKKTLVKQHEVLGKFNADNYKSKRIYATAKDGTKIPVSLVYRKGLKKNGKNPTLLYGYGSYGINIDPSFSSNRLSLLDRGFVFAIAHVRGSSLLGRPWYEDGKLLKKMNTFTDFIAAAEFLIAEDYTSRDKLFAMGGSAGGLLMGTVINLRPDLFRGVVAAVPFVDVVTTMLDDSIPLTTGEYDEWGNPNNKTYYEYMLSYSPYDNVKAQDYPNLLVTTGFHDSQVQYWEPAKWVAKLRTVKTDKNLLLLKTNMDAGHSGTTGRFSYLREVALDYAFLLHLSGIKS